MGDKYLAHLFFEEHGIASPRSWLPAEVPGDARYPRARQGAGRVRVAAHLPCRPTPTSSPSSSRYTTVDSFVQETCQGEEFSIDVFCDLEARCLNAIPRTMILSKGGESIRGMSIQDRELIEHGARVAEAIGIVGPANVQCFREPDGSLPVTDVNPRFGGAFPLPLAAGSRYPELALALARGERPRATAGRLPRGRRDDALLLRPVSDAGRRRRWCRSRRSCRTRSPPSPARREPRLGTAPRRGGALVVLARRPRLEHVAVPWRQGYDATASAHYADVLGHEHRLPRRDETDVWHNPPLFFLVAGALYRSAETVDVIQPGRVVQLWSALCVLGIAVLTFALARELAPQPALAGAAGVAPGRAHALCSCAPARCSTPSRSPRC